MKIADLLAAAALIKQGKLVAFPTETVYGLGASLFDEEAIQCIFDVKGRPSDNPLIVHVSSLEQVEQIAQEIPPLFYRLAKAFWPGPLTCVLKKRDCVSKRASGGLDTVAVRMPKHPLALELIHQVGSPLVAPSANLSGRPSPTNADDVLEDLGDLITAVVDGGDCQIGIESTVVSLLEEVPRILRPGSITTGEISQQLDLPILEEAIDSSVPLCPGMKYRHYAPRCPLFLVDSLEQLSQSSKRRLILSAIDQREAGNWGDFFLLSAQNLYSLLRQADRKGYDEVVIIKEERLCSDRALFNRVKKAETSALLH